MSKLRESEREGNLAPFYKPFSGSALWPLVGGTHDDVGSVAVFGFGWYRYSVGIVFPNARLRAKLRVALRTQGFVVLGMHLLHSQVQDPISP